MSNPTELLPGTSIAATSWVKPEDGTAHLRVYTQDIKGGIRETRWDKSWSGGSSKDVIATAKPYSPLAVLSYNNGTSIRVYYLTVENAIQEIAQDNGGEWFSGDLSSYNFKASPVSRLAVIGNTWNNNYFSIYYQRPDEALGEIKQDDNGWSETGKIGDKPLLGTGLAAVSFDTKSETGIRVYYQLPDRNLAEAGVDKGGKWVSQLSLPKINEAAPASNLAAFAHGVDNPFLQLYFLGPTNTPTEWGFYSGAWHGPNHPGHTTTSPGSGIAVIPVWDVDNLRLYYQDPNNAIQELVWKKGDSDWQKGALIPVGNLQ